MRYSPLGPHFLSYGSATWCSFTFKCNALSASLSVDGWFNINNTHIHTVKIKLYFENYVFLLMKSYKIIIYDTSITLPHAYTLIVILILMRTLWPWIWRNNVQWYQFPQMWLNCRVQKGAWALHRNIELRKTLFTVLLQTPMWFVLHSRSQICLCRKECLTDTSDTNISFSHLFRKQEIPSIVQRRLNVLNWEIL